MDMEGKREVQSKLEIYSDTDVFLIVLTITRDRRVISNIINFQTDQILGQY